MSRADQEAQTKATCTPLSQATFKLLEQGKRAAQSGDAKTAMRSLTSALASAPDNAEILRWTGVVALNMGDYVEAEKHFQRAVNALPNDADLRSYLGMALHNNGDINAATKAFEHACELAPNSVRMWYNLSETLKPQGRIPEALDALQRALELDRTSIRVQLALAHAQIIVGLTKDAVTRLRDTLRQDPTCAEAWVMLSNMNTARFDASDIQQMKQVLGHRDLTLALRIQLQFALAHAFEDEGDYAKAFDMLAQANRLQRKQVHWDGAAEHKRMEAVMQVFEAREASICNEGQGGEVIFIVSLPRSGSSLVEQILASHPEVEGANEINILQDLVDAETNRHASKFPRWVPDATTEDWQRLGGQYLARTVRWREHKPRFTDKSLINWMLVGPALEMLPAARVVIVSRDPVETCLGCYRQWFDYGVPFSYSLEEVADFYIDFARLSYLWIDKYPKRVFNLKYEALLATPETAIRELLDFCQLPFAPACLEFYRTERMIPAGPSAMQIRRPLQQNTSRAAGYGSKLDALRQRLRDGGLYRDKFSQSV